MALTEDQRGSCFPLVLALLGSMFISDPRLLAQGKPPNIAWERTLGSENAAFVSSILQTADGGYLAVGAAGDPGTTDNDIHVFRMDDRGTMLWGKRLGGEYNDTALSVIEARAGGFVLTGSTFLPETRANLYLGKLDSAGGLSWEASLGASDSYERGASLHEVDGGGYVVTGTRVSRSGDSDMYLVRTDGSGAVSWERAFGGSGSQEGNASSETSDGGYILVGTTDDRPRTQGFDIYLVKTDAEGQLEWEKVIGGWGHDYGQSVIEASQGGYALVGTTHSLGDYFFGAVYLARTDSEGTVLWEKTFGGKSWEEGRSVAQTKDGGFIIAGETASFSMGHLDIYLVKTDQLGSALWEGTFGATLSDKGYSARQTADGGYVVAGELGQFRPGGGAYVMKLEAERAISFIRGDSHADGQVNLSDALNTLRWLFLFPGERAIACGDAADANDDGRIDVIDPILTLAVLFRGGAPMPFPGAGRCGQDPSEDALRCLSFGPCEP